MSKKTKRTFSLRKMLVCCKVAVAATILLTSPAKADQVDGKSVYSAGGCTGYTSQRIARKEAMYHMTIVTYSAKYGINPNLIKAVISVESC